MSTRPTAAPDGVKFAIGRADAGKQTESAQTAVSTIKSCRIGLFSSFANSVAAEPTKLRRALSGEKKQPLGLPPNNSRQTCRLTARIDIMQALNAGRQDNGRPLRAVTAPLRQPQERHLGRDSPAGTVAAVVILATETRVFDGFAPFAKSANVRVSQGFEDMERTTPVSDNLKSALASLSRSVQSERKPPVRATGE